MKFRLAADIGGTFTDVVRLASNGSCESAKVPTTVPDLALGLVEGFDQLTRGDYSDVVDIVHGTTHGLNAVIERRGAPTAVITTKGFRDIYEIGRGNHPEMYNPRYRKPRPLVGREDIFEIDERVRGDGSVETPLDEAGAEELARHLVGRYEAVAICLINSFVNSAHEQALLALLEDRLDAAVAITASGEISAEAREFERFSTAILNAYIAPTMRGYLALLKSLLADRGYRGRIAIMNSGGGVMGIEQAAREPVRTLMSGPVGGAIGARAVASALGIEQLVAVDMGGTSFDVTLIEGERLDVSLEASAGGVPILVPSVHTVSVGAGGGSIVWTEAGALRVGPRSAGSRPGPICYRRGGVEPTVTDANLVLGHFSAADFLGGGMELDAPAAETALTRYGEDYRLSAAEAAAGVVEIANHLMADAVRELTLWRGKDVRDFTVLAYGGAGPMHAAQIAGQLGVTRAVVPPAPGAFSAWGMLHAATVDDLAVPVLSPLHELTVAWFDELAGDLRAALLTRAPTEPQTDDAREFEYSLDLRYTGQEYAVNLPLTGSFDRDRVRVDFEAKYESLYGFHTSTAEVTVVNVRATVTAEPAFVPVLTVPAAVAPERRRRGLGSEGRATPRAAGVAVRSDLPARALAGPLIVAELTATTVVPAGWTLFKRDDGCLEIRGDRGSEGLQG